MNMRKVVASITETDTIEPRVKRAPCSLAARRGRGCDGDVSINMRAMPCADVLLYVPPPRAEGVMDYGLIMLLSIIGIAIVGIILVLTRARRTT